MADLVVKLDWRIYILCSEFQAVLMLFGLRSVFNINNENTHANWQQR
jgi:hypothetical protein